MRECAKKQVTLKQMKAKSHPTANSRPADSNRAGREFLKECRIVKRKAVNATRGNQFDWCCVIVLAKIEG